MEPELPTPRLTPEHGPIPTDQNGERLPEFSPETRPESVPERSAEQAARKSEVDSRPSDQPAAVLPTPVATDDDSTDGVADDSPAVAADDDLIEKEWVDRAKQILTKTKDDPFQREQEISRLQADYLKKRYGKELGSSNF